MNPRLLVWLVLCVAAAASGCGASSYPVKGQIVFPDGSPVKDLAAGGVAFELIDGHYSAISMIDANARFELYTIKAGDGVRPGKYRVVITPQVGGVADQGQKPPPPPPPPNPIDKKYLSAATSGLEVLVDKAMTDLKLTVEPSPKRMKK